MGDDNGSMIYLGTSSWTFQGWRDSFYPAGLAANQYLQFYARQFRAVEVNTSFYAQPKPATLIKWVEETPTGFRFCLKFPRAISHEKRLHGCEVETAGFLDTLRALGESAGPAFLQLPPTLGRKIGGRSIANYVDRLADEREDLAIAVEVRSADLMTPQFAEFLAERNMALVLAVTDKMPDLYDIWMSARGTVDFVFIRWIGDSRTGPRGDHEIQKPRDQELALWANRIVEMQEMGLSVFGFVHNPFEGHSPATVRRLLANVEQQTELPEWPPDAENSTAAQMQLL